MDVDYVLKLLKEAQYNLVTITPKLEHAYQLGTAEGCIGVAIRHIEAQWIASQTTGTEG